MSKKFLEATQEELVSTKPSSKLTAARAPWDDAVFVCRKCMRKQKNRLETDGLSLSKWLKRALKKSGKNNIRVIESGCFDLCPKKGIALVRGSELAARTKPLRVLRRGDDVGKLLLWLEYDLKCSPMELSGEGR